MPELPEVETTRRGVAPRVVGRRIDALIVRDRRLRWPVPAGFEATVAGRRIVAIDRRAKYMLVRLDDGSGFLVHLGMSGSLRLCVPATPLRTHDHLLWRLSDASSAHEDAANAEGVEGEQANPAATSLLELRLHDPRRFGACLPLDAAGGHRLLEHLGPEPFDAAFNADSMRIRARARKVAIKAFLMSASTVVGVGNIYASEALFLAGIRPARAAGRVTGKEWGALVDAVRRVLAHAIERGGTTLRDFVHEDGSHGYFAQELYVYGRAGQDCRVCGSAIRSTRIGQRASAWCPTCQR